MNTVFHAPLLARVKRAVKASVALLLVAGLAFPAHAADEPHAVTHALGTTTVQPNPQRIITLGWSGEDVVIALGEVPVAMPRYTFFDSGMFPWVEEKLDGQRPELLSGESGDSKVAVRSWVKSKPSRVSSRSRLTSWVGSICDLTVVCVVESAVIERTVQSGVSS